MQTNIASLMIILPTHKLRSCQKVGFYLYSTVVNACSLKNCGRRELDLVIITTSLTRTLWDEVPTRDVKLAQNNTDLKILLYY